MGLLHSIIGDDTGSISLLQMHVRALAVFVIGLTLIRLTTPRIFSSKATPIDIIISVIIGSNLSRTLTGNAPFLDVIIVTTSLVILHAAVTYLASRWRPLANLVKGKPAVLVRDGEINWKEMHANAIGKRDIMAALRQSGGNDLDDIELATMERGGDIEIVFVE